MAGAATIRALVNRRARSGSRGSSQDHDGPGLVSDRLYRPRWLGWQLRAGETRPVSNASSLRGSTQGRRRRGQLSGGVPGGDEKRTRNRAMNCVMRTDRKSTRLNSSHGYISYAVFCLKKKKKKETK